MGRKKKFIEKGEGVKFYLVHRSQKDPLFLDENLGEHVLVPADPNTSKDLLESINGLSLSNKDKKSEKEELKKKRLEEQQKFGIYYEDDYNYLQHLKEVNPEDESAELDKLETIKIGSVLIKNDLDQEPKSSKLQLPSSVFASNFEEDVGYFNQAAPDHDPKISWDPDIVKILDEDPEINFEDEDNQLDDDFFVKANLVETNQTTQSKTRSKKHHKYEDDDDDDDNDDSDDDDDFESDEADDHEEEEEDDNFETKSRFSNYSMTSSVIRRNEALRQLDQHFEKLYAQYDEDQIGALDTEEIEGYRNYDDLVLESALKEFSSMMEKKTLITETGNKKKLGVVIEQNESNNEDELDEESCTDTLTDEHSSDDDDDDDDTNNEEENQDENNNNKKDYQFIKLTKKKSKEDRLDCESIISTYSNIYNRPLVIADEKESNKIKLSQKTGLPLGVLAEKKKSQKQLEIIDHKITRILPSIPQRKENESKEEKKVRKQMVKEHRRERRVEKKINKLAFKQEKAQQIKISQTILSNSVKLPL